MAGVNKVILVGNLGADPEARSLTNGGEVVNLRVATTESWKDRSGERQERTEWHRVVIFNESLGRVAKSYLRKGSKVYLEGKLQTRKWTDQSGRKNIRPRSSSRISEASSSCSTAAKAAGADAARSTNPTTISQAALRPRPSRARSRRRSTPTSTTTFLSRSRFSSASPAPRTGPPAPH